MSPRRSILIEHRSSEALADALAAELGEAIDQALLAGRRACLALAGGRTPLPAYRLLGAQRRDWARVTVVPTDERWVDAGHASRNDHQLAESFGASAGLDLRQLVPAKTHGPVSARHANAALADLRGPFDLVLLGMGDDAHTASLFPGGLGLAEALRHDASDAAFCVTPQPLPAEAPYPRVSLGLRRLLDARRHVLALIGTRKRAVFDAACAAPEPPIRPISAFCTLATPLTVHWSPR